MANEKRLIDANEFWNRLSNVVYDIFAVHEKDGQLTNTASVGYYTETIQEVLKQTKTVDAVEVVRCKDCKHWDEENKELYTYDSKPENKDNLVDFAECLYWSNWSTCHSTRFNDFCSLGERRMTVKCNQLCAWNDPSDGCVIPIGSICPMSNVRSENPTGIVGNFDGYPLIASPFMADAVQARKHKKKRINKKWRKRYGTRQVPWKKFLLFDGKIYGHPKMIDKLIVAIKAQQPTKENDNG